MKSLRNKLIVYDSNCKVCSSLRDVVLKITTIPEQKVKAYKDLSPQLSALVDPDKFKNVMALIDTADGDTIYGAEGVAYIFSSQFRVADFLLDFRPVFKLFNFLYKTQAYNRYIIATPKSNFKCDCLPDPVLKYRISYIALATIVSVFLTLIFGGTLEGFVPGITWSQAAFHMLLMAGTGWVLQILLSIILLKNRALEYIGHLSSIMVSGLLILVPWMLFSIFFLTTNIFLPAFSVLVSSSWMLYLHVNRIRYMELSNRWNFSWFMLLQAGAFFWIYFFHIQ